jgi:hypothetical protein
MAHPRCASTTVSEIRFMVQLTDGSVQYIQGSPADHALFERLSGKGMKDRPLLDLLFTGGWEVAPLFVVVTATSGDGPPTAITLHYR